MTVRFGKWDLIKMNLPLVLLFALAYGIFSFVKPLLPYKFGAVDESGSSEVEHFEDSKTEHDEFVLNLYALLFAVSADGFIFYRDFYLSRFLRSDKVPLAVDVFHCVIHMLTFGMAAFKKNWLASGYIPLVQIFLYKTITNS